MGFLGGGNKCQGKKGLRWNGTLTEAKVERLDIRGVNSHYHSFLAMGARGLGAVDPNGVCVVYCYSKCALCDQKQIKVSLLVWFKWLS